MYVQIVYYLISFTCKKFELQKVVRFPILILCIFKNVTSRLLYNFLNPYKIPVQSTDILWSNITMCRNGNFALVFFRGEIELKYRSKSSTNLPKYPIFEGFEFLFFHGENQCKIDFLPGFAQNPTNLRNR